MFAAKAARTASVFVALFALGAGAQAASYTFDTGTNLGNWSATQANTDANTSYTVGNSAGTEWRNFFTFSLASLAPNEQVVSATLQLRKWWYYSTDPTENVGFYDVSTPTTALNNNDGFSAAIFNDLGTGTSYGSVSVAQAGSTTDIVDVSLNAAARAAIASAAGGSFSIGGSCLTCGTGQTVFGTSNAAGIQQLVVQTAPIPEPSTYAMLGVGLAALAFLRRRKIA
jgi:hypothetical protein